MGQQVSAIIEHQLSPEDIIALPKLLQSRLQGDLAGEWAWTFGKDIHVGQLSKTWGQDETFFLNHTWSEADLPLLRYYAHALYFGEPHIVHFDSDMKWSSYADSKEWHDTFNSRVKQLCDIIGATDVILVPSPFDTDLSEDGSWRVADYRKAFGDLGLKYFELER